MFGRHWGSNPGLHVLHTSALPLPQQPKGNQTLQFLKKLHASQLSKVLCGKIDYT